MLFGLSIGLGVALVVYLQSGLQLPESGTTARLGQPSGMQAEAPVSPLPAPTPSLAATSSSMQSAGDGAKAPTDRGRADAAVTGADASPARVRSEPQFGFYESLADFEVVVPQSIAEERASLRPAASSESAAPPPAAQADAEDKPRVMIQAGSFRAAADADTRKANLALLGIESVLRRVSVNDGIYHRVMIGPITDPAEYARVTQRLNDANIVFMIAPTN